MNTRNTRIMFVLLICAVSWMLLGCDDGDPLVGSGLGGEIVDAVVDDVSKVSDSPAGNAVKKLGDALPTTLSGDVAKCVIDNNCGK